MSRSANETNECEPRAFTLKSLFFSLLGIVSITGLASIQWNLVSPNPPLIGNHLPAGVFFYVMVVVLFWNGLVGRLVPRLALNGRELAVVMGVSLVAAFPPTSGLFRYFHRQIMLPWYYLSTGGKPEWESLEVLSYLPERMFPTPVPRQVDGVLEMDQAVYNSFFTGMKTGDTTYGLRDIPWQAWLTPLLFWGPVVFLMSIAVIALSLVVHQQWVKHEQLSYPIAQVAHAFVHRAKGVGVPDLFRSKFFWWGFTPLFILYGIEYLHQWFPEYIPSLNVILPNLKRWNINLFQAMPALRRAPNAGALTQGSLFFCIVGLAYFVSSEISFTLGFGHIILAIVGVWVFSVRGTPIGGNELTMVRSGAYIGYAAILLYTGRTFYWSVAKKAFFIGRPQDHESGSVMAARIFILAFGGFVSLLAVAGLDWTIAIFFTLLLMLIFLVLSRLVCETGVPFVQTGWMPGPVMNSILGSAAVGPRPLVWIGYLGSVLVQDPRESLMPYASTALRVADDSRIKPKRIFWVLVAATLAAIVVGFVTSHWTLYNYGGMSTDTWASRYVPNIVFNAAANNLMEMQDMGMMAESESRQGLGKLALLSPIREDMAPFALGIVGVLAVSFARFRFSKFPIHPAFFLVLGYYAGYVSWYSFAVGWAIKIIVVRFGGGKVYQNLKPLFIGIITAELTAVGLCISITLLYYRLTGEVPAISFGILPG